MKKTLKSDRGANAGSLPRLVGLSPSDWGRIRTALRTEITIEINQRRDSSFGYFDDYMAASKKREKVLRATLEKVRHAGKPNTKCSDAEHSATTPGPAVSPREWDRLGDISRQFLRDAENGGMMYACEKGEVCAWGVAIAGIFSMEVHAEKHSVDGYIVTLPNASANQ